MPLSMRSRCGFQAAPRIVGGSLSISSDSNVLTWAKNPQKSQMMSAHLKFGGSVLSVCFFLQLGQTCDFATSFSPRLPDFWLRVVMRERLITHQRRPQGQWWHAIHVLYLAS